MSEAESDRWEHMPTNPMGFGGGGNYILRPKDDDSFAISYQPDGNAMSQFGSWLFAADNESDETAICDYRGERAAYYILNGDFRGEYEKLVDSGIDACLKFYESQKDQHQSTWSTDKSNER